VPVELSVEHRRHAHPIYLAAFDHELQHRIVQALRHVIGRLVVRIDAALEQEARQLGVARDTRGTVDNALEARLRLVVLRVEPGLRARACLRRSRADRTNPAERAGSSRR
jgi:hypothetical protein